MKTQFYPQRGEIYFLEFGKSPGASSPGASMKGGHPALVVQNNTANRYSGVILIAPITSNLKVCQLPIGVAIHPPEGGLTKPSAIHCGQIHTVDRNEFTKTRFCGRISLFTMQKVNKALKISLDLE